MFEPKFGKSFGLGGSSWPEARTSYSGGDFVGKGSFGDKGDYHHTNIDSLIENIEAAGFRKIEVVRLPFSWLPCLFKICVFKRMN